MADDTTPNQKDEQPFDTVVSAMFAPGTEAYYANIFGITYMGDEVLLGFGQANPNKGLGYEKRIYMTRENAIKLRDLINSYLGPDEDKG
jgi:hypothetical protein